MNAIRPAVGTLLSQNAFGRTLSVGGKTSWRHPWFTTPQWSAERKEWTCLVKAGFVNGRSPLVTTSVGALREARGTFFGQIVDARSGAAEIAQAARLASSSDDYAGQNDDMAIEVPLYKNPPIGLRHWKRVARPSLYFRDRGAAPPPPSGINMTSGKITIVEAPKGARVLLACDVIIHQPRAALTSTVEISAAGAVTGTSIVNQTLSMRPAAEGDQLRIQTGSFDTAEEAAADFSAATQLLDNYEEKNWDRLKVSTVFLLSPPDTAEDAAPDEKWEPYVQHAQFWNLSWYQPLLREAVLASDIFRPLLGTLSVLGGGAGFLWASSVTASINDAMQGAYNILKATSLAGSFWTPTGGGGTTAAAPTATAAAPVKQTFDKAANSAARAKATFATAAARRLDPPFPYEGLKFNPAFLT